MIIYKDEDTEVESIGDDIYRITSDASSDQPNSSDYVTVVLTIEELEGIYAAIIHYNAKPEADCCGNCEYCAIEEQGNFSQYDCRRNAPPVTFDINCVEWYWPSTKQDNWCGEHRRKE